MEIDCLRNTTMNRGEKIGTQKKPHVDFNHEKWLITCFPYRTLFVSKILIIVISVVEKYGHSED